MGKHLFIDDLDNQHQNRLQIAGAVSLYGYVNEDGFSVSGSANYESKYDRMIQDSPIGKIINSEGAQFAKNFFGLQLKSLASTAVGYVDSQNPEFQIQVILVATSEAKEAKNYDNARKALASVYPDTISMGGIQGIITPPNGFQIDNRTENSRVTVEIGEWFRATYQVITNVQFTFSKEVTPRGYPLYITGTISFMPDRQISAADMKGYFLL